MRKKINKKYESTNPSSSEKFISAALSYPTGNFYCASDEIRNIYLWKAGMKDPIITLSDHSSAVHYMLFNSDDAELFAGMKGGKISQWDIQKRKIKNDLVGHSTQITAMAFHRKNNEACVLSSASAEGKIKIWDLKSKSSPINFKGHFTEVDCLTFSPDFTYLASGSQDGVVKIWDIRMTQKSLKEIVNKDKKGINCIKFNPWKTVLAFGSKDKTIKYWDMKNFELIGQTNPDRLPIEQIEYDNQGNNLFYATNEALKYWEIGEKGFSLITMHETGWNRLQDFRYIEGKEICACSIYGNKLSYYSIKYKEIFGKIGNVSIMSNIEENFEESQSSAFFDDSDIHLNLNFDINKNQRKIPASAKNKSQKKFDEYQNSNPVLEDLNINEPAGISKFINTSTTNVTVSNNNSNIIGNESIFMKNAMNMINPPEKNSKKSTNSNQDISIGNFISPNLINATTNSINFENAKSEFEQSLDGANFNEFLNSRDQKLDYSIIKKENQEDSFLDEPIFLSTKRDKETIENNKENKDIENKNNNNNTRNKDNASMTNTSFKSYKTNETMGLDIDKFENTNPENDIPILTELSNKHDNLCNIITNRYNSMKNIEKSWNESNISSAIHFMKILKDPAVINDFFYYAIVRKENINIIPFTLDHSLELIPYIKILIQKNYESYNINGIKSGIIFVQLLKDKVKDTYKNKQMNNNNYDPKLDDRIQKCDKIVECFKEIYQMKELDKLKRKQSSKKTHEFATQLYDDIGNLLNSIS